MKIRAILLAVLLCMPAIVSAQGSTAGINGTWDIVMNDFGGKITFSSGGGVLNMSGYPQEEISNLRFDGSTIRFIRVSSFGLSSDQVFTGTVSGNTMKGTLTQANIPGGIYQWNATRPGGNPVPIPLDFVSPPPAGPWESFPPDIRSFAAQPGRVFPLKQGDFPAGNYMIFIAPTGKDGRSAPIMAKPFGPYTLRSEKRYKSWIQTSGKALGWEEESADLLRYGHPLPGFARIYFRNNVDGDEWYAILVLPARGDPIPAGFVTPPPTCRWTQFPPDMRSHGGQIGRVFPVRPGDIRAGRYMIFVAPIGKDGRGTPNIARAIGPYTLRSEKRYKGLIHTSGKVLGWEEESADLLDYRHPLPGLSIIYARNNVDGDEWYAICAQWMGPTDGGGGGGHTGIDIIVGIWKNTDHVHQGCRDVQSFCKAYKRDVQFSKTADGALEGQLVGQSFIMVGELQGQTWDFKATMNGSYHGKGSFIFSQDFKSFKGEFTDINGHHVVWSGSR